MVRKITVTLDNELLKLLRGIQSKQIKKESQWISFSQVINDVLRESFEKHGTK